MGLTCILTEKPSVAKNIAFVLNATENKTGYMQGNGYIVTYGFGHLLMLQDAEDYNSIYKVWKLDNYPFIPDEYKHRVMDDDGVIKQFGIIKGLFNRPDVDYIIIATDADREGEAIGITIYNATGCSKPIKRLWISEQTPEDVRRGLNNLIDNEKMIPLQQAALTRQYIDWSIGINLSAVATLKYGNGKLLRIGRVILPCVKLVFDRHMSIKKFVPVQFYELKAGFVSDKGNYEGVYIDEKDNTRFDNIQDAEALKSSLNTSIGLIISKDTTRSKEKPKKLFNLNDLQGYITTHYNNLSSLEVAKITRSLYEKKYISYPGTSSRYLEETLVPKAEKVLEALTKDSDFKNVKFTASKDVFDSSKVVSHSAIIPTYILPDDSLTNDEKVVYEEIKKRFISQFMPPAEYSVTELKTSIEGKIFVTRGKVLISKGWKELYNNQETEDEDKDGLKQIPELVLNEKVNIQGMEILNRKTTAPKPYTEATLLKAMENCGKDIPDDDVSGLLAGFELGTSETRARILDNILKVGYLKLSGKTINITDMGIRLVEKLPVDELFDINFTGQLEKKLKDIENGNFTMGEYLQEIHELVSDSVDRMKELNTFIVDKDEKEIVAKCPDCGKDVYEGEKSYFCSGFKEGCKFSVWKENKLLEKYGMKKITKSLAKVLIENKSTRICVNYTKFIFINMVKSSDRWRVEFEFPSEEVCKSLREVLGKCPVCGKSIYENLYAYSCENYKNGCDFTIYKENKLLDKFGVKKVTKALFKELLTMKKITIKVSPTTFIYAALKKDESRWSINFEFPSQEEKQSLREVIGKCPECGGNVYENNYGFACEKNIKDNPNRCKFMLQKEDKFFGRYKKKINKSMAKSFLKDKKAEVKGLYSETKDKEFDATIVMFKNGDYWNFKFDFDSKKK